MSFLLVTGSHFYTSLSYVYGQHFAQNTREINKNQLVIIAFGNSTTAERETIQKVYSQRLPEKLLKEGIEAKLINAGVGGNTTEDAKKRFERDVLQQKPDMVIIQFGLNDSAVDVHKGKMKPRISLKKYEGNLGSFIRTLHERGVTVILMTPNPMRWTNDLVPVYGIPPYNINNPKGLNFSNRHYAQKVRYISRRMGVHLIDIYRHLVFDNNKRYTMAVFNTVEMFEDD